MKEKQNNEVPMFGCEYTDEYYKRSIERAGFCFTWLEVVLNKPIREIGRRMDLELFFSYTALEDFDYYPLEAVSEAVEETFWEWVGSCTDKDLKKARNATRAKAYQWHERWKVNKGVDYGATCRYMADLYGRLSQNIAPERPKKNNFGFSCVCQEFIVPLHHQTNKQQGNGNPLTQNR